MAACSSGVARPAVSLITETRYCISDHLLWYGVPLVGGLSPLLRTHLPRSDTASRTSFKIFWYAVRRHADGPQHLRGVCGVLATASLPLGRPGQCAAKVRVLVEAGTRRVD